MPSVGSFNRINGQDDEYCKYENRYLGWARVLGLVLVMVALSNLGSIGDSSREMIKEDWVRSSAAQTINATARANARRTMELFFARDAAASSAILQYIDSNKKSISDDMQALKR